ncbi:MAG: hypothetical protein AB7V43_15060, partial [Acidimicrobiia bacterium]
ACDGEGPVLTARTLPEAAPTDAEAVTDTTVIGVAPGAEVPTTSVAADPRTTLPPDIEDGDDG